MNAPTPTSPTTAAATPNTKIVSPAPTSAPLVAKPAPLTPSGAKPKMIQAAPPFSMGAPNTAVSKWLKLFVYARPGGGKTTLLGSAADVPQMRDVLYIDAEKGYMAIAENPRIKNPELVMENRIPVDNFKTVAMIHDYLKGHCKHRDENNIEKLRESEARIRGCSPEDIIEPKKFYTVLIDSMTEVDIYCTYGLLGLTQEKLLHGEASDIDVARFDEFRKNNQMVQMLCRAFRDLPIHVLAASHEKYSEDELKKKTYMPALTGQLANQVPGFFDIVGWLTFVKEGDNLTRKMMVQPVGNFVAKNRRAVYKPDHFRDPTMMDIMKGCGLLKPELPVENAK